MLRDMTCSARYSDLTEHGHENGDTEQRKYLCHADSENSAVLAGLHACGDLSVMMLKWVHNSALEANILMFQLILSEV